MVRPPTSTRDLSPAQHLFRLRSMHPDGRGATSKRELYWTQTATPTTWSDTYELLLYMDHLRVPRVHVLTPKLYSRLDPRMPLEHVYHPGQYDGAMNLADSVIPWGIEWLLHYETWSVTGEWRGGGKHPEPRSPSEPGEGAHGSWVHAQRRPRETERSRFERAFRALFPGRPPTDALNWR